MYIFFFYKMHIGNEAVRNKLMYHNFSKMEKNVSRNLYYGKRNKLTICLNKTLAYKNCRNDF